MNAVDTKLQLFGDKKIYQSSLERPKFRKKEILEHRTKEEILEQTKERIHAAS